MSQSDRVTGRVAIPRDAEIARRRAALELVFKQGIADCAAYSDRLNKRRNEILDAATPELERCGGAR